FWLRPDAQLFLQNGSARLVRAQRRGAVAGRRVYLDQPPVGALVEWIQPQPAIDRLDGACARSGLCVQLRQPVDARRRPPAPDFALHTGPVVEVRRIAQGETFEELASPRLRSLLQADDRGAALFVRRALRTNERAHDTRRGLQALRIQLEVGGEIEA